MRKSIKVFTWIVILIIFALLILISSLTQFYTDWLWFKNLNISKTFITMFFSNFFLRLLLGLIFTIFIYINLLFTKKPLINYLQVDRGDNVETLFSGSENHFKDWLSSRSEERRVGKECRFRWRRY